MPELKYTEGVIDSPCFAVGDFYQSKVAMILISPGLDQRNKNPKREMLPERCQWGSDKLIY